MSSEEETGLPCEEEGPAKTDSKQEGMSAPDPAQRGNFQSSAPPGSGRSNRKKTGSLLIILLAILFIALIAIGILSLVLINGGSVSSGTAPVTPVQTAVPTPAGTTATEAQADAACSDGISLLNQSRSEDALRSFDEAIRLNPGSPRAWTGKGYALIDLGRSQEGIAAFDSALRLNASYRNAKTGRQIASEALGIRS